MENIRQGRAIQPERVAALVKGNNSVPHPKPPTSAAVMLRRSSNDSKKRNAPAVLRHPVVRIANAGPRPSPGTVPNNALDKANEPHPLASAFNDTTQSYRSAIYEHAVQEIDESLAQFLTKLHDSDIATSTSGIRASEPTGPIQKIALTEAANQNTEKLFRRVGSYNVLMGHYGDGIEKTLDDGLTEFSTRHRTRFEELHVLEKRWEITVTEIWKVGVGCLGQSTTRDLLMQRSPSVLPAYNEQSDLTPRDSEPKPAHKKVKFQQLNSGPHPELPKFLSAETLYNEFPRPTPISKGNTKKLEPKVDCLGTQQMKELTVIEKESRHSWAKKLRGVLHLLRDD